MIRRAEAMQVKQKIKKPKASGTTDNSTEETPKDTKNGIRTELLSHNEHFKQMINLIPANFYFGQESKDKLEEHKSAALESLRKGKHSHGRELSEKAQRKRLKYDPTVQHRITDLQKTLIEDEEREKGKKNKRRKIDHDEDDDDDDSSLMSSVESLNELHKKLQNKIEALRVKRHAMSNKTDWAEKRRMKRKEKRVKQKMKNKSIKMKGQTSNSVNSTEKITTASPSKPIFNKEGKMVFSKFDFSANASEKKESDNMPTGSKKYKKLLEKAEQRKQKIDQLKETDQEQAHSLEKKMSWQSALKKAEGTKVKDNPELIKKTMKRQEKLKQKSRKEWTERSDKVQQKIKERQDKRKKNIKSKKQSKVDKKMKKAKKKGHVVPGF